MHVARATNTRPRKNITPIEEPVSRKVLAPDPPPIECKNYER